MRWVSGAIDCSGVSCRPSVLSTREGQSDRNGLRWATPPPSVTVMTHDRAPTLDDVARARRRHPLLTEAVREQISFVTVNRSVELPGVPAVVGDDADGVTQAVAHLRSLGHTRIAHLAGPQDLSTGAVRLRAFQHAAPA